MKVHILEVSTRYINGKVTQWKSSWSSKNASQKPDYSGPVEFEDAIAATGFGKFNILLMAFIFPAAFGLIFNTTTMSYVIPSAECDLSLSLLDKGLLNAITHTGMIFSAFLTGYLADTLGRKRMLAFCFLLDGVSNFSSSFSQNFLTLVTLKFLAGFFLCGAYTVLLSNIAEFHAVHVRPTIIMFAGFCYSLASLAIPGIAWSILAEPWEINITTNYVFHGWQVFIAVCSLPSLGAGLLALLVPESPRFLASRGRHEEALHVLRCVYAANSGNPPDTYPVKQLKTIRDDDEDSPNEVSPDDKEATAPSDARRTEDTVNGSVKGEVIQQEHAPTKEGALAALRGGWRQMRPLMQKPNISNILLIFIIQFGCLLGCNTLRLWLPQLFKMMSEQQQNSDSLCEMISVSSAAGVLEAPRPEGGVCEPIIIKDEAYINSMIVAGVQVVFCCIASIIVSWLGKRRLLSISLLSGGACALALYWCSDAAEARALAAISVAFSAIASNATLSVLVDLFPTALRAMTVSLVLMVGRLGSISGNLTFPSLLASGCLPPFAALGSILGGCALLSMLIPAPKNIGT